MGKRFRGRHQPSSKSAYIQSLVKMNDREFVNECARILMLKKATGLMNNADVHWQAEECLKDSKRRGTVDLYEQAVAKVNQNQSH